MFRALFINFTIILSLIFLLKQCFKQNPINEYTTWPRRVLYGMGYGLIGMVMLEFTVPVASHVYADLRFIPLILSSLYGGTLPSFITALMIGLSRVIFFPFTSSTWIACAELLFTTCIFIPILNRNLNLMIKVILMLGIVYIETFLIFYYLIPSIYDFLQFAFYYGISLFFGGIVAFSFSQYVRHSLSSVEELRMVKDQLESLVQQSGDAIVITDEKFLVQKANTAFTQLYGWSENEMVGKTIPTLHPNQDDLMQQVKGIESSDGPHFSKFETLCFHKNGGSRYISVTVSPINDANGNLIGYNGISHDLTERKSMEEELKTTKEQLEAFIYHSPDPVTFLDMERKIVKVNPAFEMTFGWTEEELIGKRSPIVPLSDRSSANEMLDLAAKGKSTIGYEGVRFHKDGTARIVNISVYLIRNGQGDPIGFSGVYRDITESKKTQELLQTSEKLSVLGELAAGIAHEIRNPLTTLKGFLQIIDKEKYSFYFDIMSSEIDRIEMITTELLFLAKPQSVQFKEKNISGILEKVIAFLTPQANLYNFQFNMGILTDLPEIRCEENHMKQLFINLIKNAMESMSNGGTIDIEAEKSGDDLIIRVRDYGEGMTEEQISKLGEPFYSLKDKGTGLGLMICKKIVQEHGGKLLFHSKPHEGTTVEIHMPIVSKLDPILVKSH